MSEINKPNQNNLIITSSETEKKHSLLQKKLFSLKFTQPLGFDSLQLVEKLLSELITTRSHISQLKEINDKLTENPDGEKQYILPFKVENSKVVKENIELHKEIIRLKEESSFKGKAFEEEMRRLKIEYDEAVFLLSQKDLKIKQVENEYEQLRRKVNAKSSVVKKEKEEIIIYSTPSFDINSYIKSIETKLNEKEQWANDLHKAEERNIKSKQDLEEIKKRLSELSDLNSSLEQQVKIRDNEIKRITDTYSPDNDQLKNKYLLESLSQQIEKLNKQVDFVNNENERLKEENGIHKHRCFFKEIQGLDKEIIRLKKENEAIRSRSISKVNTKVNSEETYIDNAKKKESQIEEEEKKLIFQLENKVNSLENENKRLSFELENIRNHYQKSQSEQKSIFNSEKEALLSQLNEIKSKNQSLNKKITEKTEKEDEILKENEALKAEVNLLKGKRLVNDCNESKDNHNDRRCGVDDRKDYSNSHMIYKEYEEQVKENLILKEKQREVELKNTDLERESKENKRNLMDLKEEISVLKEENMKIKQEFKEKSKENSQFSKKILEEKENSSNLKKKLTQIEEEKHQFERILHQKQRIIQDFESETQNLKNELQSKEETLLKLKYENRSFQEDNLHLKNRLKLQEEEMKSNKQRQSNNEKLEEDELNSLKHEKIVLLNEKDFFMKRVLQLEKNLSDLSEINDKFENEIEELKKKHVSEKENLNNQILSFQSMSLSTKKHEEISSYISKNIQLEKEEIEKKLVKTKAENEILKEEKSNLEFNLKKERLEKASLFDQLKSVKDVVQVKNEEIKEINQRLKVLKESNKSVLIEKSDRIHEEILVIQEEFTKEKAKNERLSFEIQEKDEKIERILEENDGLNKEKQDLIRKITELTMLKTEFLTKLQSEVSKRKALEEEKEMKKEGKEGLSVEILKAKDEIKNLKAGYSAISSKYDKLVDELDNKTEENLKITQNIEEVKRINSEINKKLMIQLEKQKDDIRNLNDKEEEIRKLKEEKNSYEQQALHIKTENDSIQNDYNQLKLKFDKAISEKKQVSEAYHKENYEKESLKSICLDMKNTNEYLSHQVISYEKSLSELTEAYRRSCIESDKLKQNLSLFINENKQADEHIKEQQIQIKDFSLLVSKFKKEREEYLKRNSLLEEKIDLTNKEVLSLKGIISQKHNEAKDLKMNVFANKEVNTTYESRLFELMTKIKEVDDEKNQIFQDFLTEKAKNEGLIGNLSRLEKEKNGLNELLANERKEMYSLECYNERLRKELNLLGSSNRSYGKEKEKEKEKEEELNRRIVLLKEELNEAEKRNEFLKEELLRREKRGD